MGPTNETDGWLGARRDLDGRTPLPLAAMSGNVNLVEIPLEREPDSSLRDCDGETSRQLATEQGNAMNAGLVNGTTRPYSCFGQFAFGASDRSLALSIGEARCGRLDSLSSDSARFGKSSPSFETGIAFMANRKRFKDDAANASFGPTPNRANMHVFKLSKLVES